MAAPVFESANAIWANFSATVTVPISPANSNRCVLAFAVVGASSPTTIDSATYNGIAMTAGTQFTASFTNEHCRMFWLVGDANIATGSHDVVVTCSDGDGKPDCVVAAYSGVSAVSGEVTATAVSASPSWTVSSATGDLVAALWMMGQGAGAVTPGTGTTSDYSDRNVNLYDEIAWSEAGASSVVIDGSVGSPTPGWEGAAVSLAAVAAATATTGKGMASR